jgi:hypothetical protein
MMPSMAKVRRSCSKEEDLEVVSRSVVGSKICICGRSVSIDLWALREYHLYCAASPVHFFAGGTAAVLSELSDQKTPIPKYNRRST